MLKYLKVNYGHHNKEPKMKTFAALQISELGESYLLNLISYAGSIPGWRLGH